MTMRISKVRKRDGKIVKFDLRRITNAIHKAMVAVGEGDEKLAKKISHEVFQTLEKEFVERIPSVEDIQDIVIKTLQKRGYEEIAKEYLEYREKKAEIRELRKELGIEEPKLSVNALTVLRKRYLLRNERNEIVETPAQMLRRVARTVSKVDENPTRAERDFYGVMSRLEFLPNSPTLFNAGAPLGQLSACFVLPVEDSLESIFEAVKNMALIEKTGGGVGFDFSKLRPRGDTVKSTKGVASGPVSFMRVFDIATEIIKAGGKRRGAMMGILRVDHPDIEEFITAKSRKGVLSNFNISVAITDDFMEKLKRDEEYRLINPRTGKPVREVAAKKIWELIVENAWRSGDPGIIFIDEINRHNPTPGVGRIEATNPCGEQPLLPHESCNLGSINLSKMVRGEEVDWEKLHRVVEISVRFLDNVIEVNKFPLPEIEEMTKANRKIGLGVMGFADLLIKLGIPYDTKEAISIAEKLMKFITETGRRVSAELGERRGSFPNFEESIWRGKYGAMRNATITTIAPTGSISIIAGCSSGIEPIFAVSFMRNVLEGTRLFEVNPVFEHLAKGKGFYSIGLLEKIAKNRGSVQGLKDVPREVRKIFRTAFDIKPEWHVRMQAAFQKHVDNSVSKTVNLPENSRKREVWKVFELAYKLKCKGVTVYRYGSKEQQVLYVSRPKHLVAGPEYSGGCPTPTCAF